MSGNELKPIETEYDGCRFRSRVEARWAVFFNAIGWRYEYEKEGFDFDGRWYLPDFHLPDFPMWIEIKGQDLTDEEALLCRKLADRSGHRVLAAIGSPRREAGIFRVYDSERDGDRCQILADRRNAGEFWLAGSEPGNVMYWAESVGPEDGPAHDRYPIVSKEMEAAITAASSARFEHGEKG